MLSRWRQSRLNDTQVFALCSMGLISVPLVLHVWAGTPSVLLSIFPGALIGHIYLASLVFYRDTNKAGEVS